MLKVLQDRLVGRPVADVPSAIRGLARRAVVGWRHHRAERQLRQLSDAQLRDIGLARTDIALAVRGDHGGRHGRGR